MSAARYFTDEDVYAGIAPALRRDGFDAVSTPECGRLGESDESQLAWASTEGRVLITFNVSHFARLHVAWIQAKRRHAGIVVSSQRPIRDTLRRLLRLANSLDSAAMQDRLEYLGDW